MPEQQNIEYKQGWHDDYLKWGYSFYLFNSFMINDVNFEYI